MIVAAGIARPLSAQNRVPWITATSGIEFVRRAAQYPSIGKIHDDHDNLFVGLALHAPLHWMVQPEVGLTTTLAADRGFRTAHFGIQLTPLRSLGANLGIGMSRTVFIEPGSCTVGGEGALDSSGCANDAHYWYWLFDARLGFDFRLHNRITLGPTLGILDPLKAAPFGIWHERVITVGVRVGRW